MSALAESLPTAMPDPIVFTDSAAAKVADLIAEEGNPDLKLRVFVQGGGCSGLMYNLDFASAPQENDMIFEDKGVKVMVDKKSILYLAGTELDFSDGLNGKGFQFINPNASRTCGCGESFSI